MYCKNHVVSRRIQTHALNCYHNLLIVIAAPTSTGSLFDLFELAFSQIYRFLSISLFSLSIAIQYMISWLSINDSTNNTPVLLLYLTDEKS